MIYDHRVYTCRPGTIKKQLALYEEFGWPAQTRILGYPVLHTTTETGDINTFTHVWAYADAAERAEKRAAMNADPEWQDYVRRSGEAGYLVSQNNSILMDNPFFERK